MRSAHTLRSAAAIIVAALAAFLSAATAVAAPPADPPANSSPPHIAPPPTIPLPPELDPGFYHPPAQIYAHKQPGDIIAARRIAASTLGLVPINVDAWQVSYRSTNSRGEPIAAVTTLLKPRGTTTAPRKLVSMQIAEDSTGEYCAPSYAIQQFSASQMVGQVVFPLEMLVAEGFLSQGWALSIPDHEGPDSAYAAGPLAGRIVLDGIRAAKNFSPLGVSAESRIGMYGYSGGAIATGHAAELKRAYAPELNIVGAAEGGVPADLGVVLQTANNNFTSGLILGAIVGLAREYPDFRTFLARQTNPLGQALMAGKAALCVQYQSATFPFLNNIGLINWPGNPLNAPPVRKVLDETRLGKSTPAMPMYIWNSALDEIVPVSQVDRLVRGYCRDPQARITYTRDHLSEHVIAEIAGAPRAFLWLKDRLDGVPAATGCTTTDELTMTVHEKWWPVFSSTVGTALSGLFGQAIGQGHL